MKDTSRGRPSLLARVLRALARRFSRAQAGAAPLLAATWAGASRAAADGAPRVAIAILEGARARIGLDRPTARLLIELHAGADDVGRAVEVAMEHLDLLSSDDVRNMTASLELWGERRYAAALAAAVADQSTATMKRRANGKRRLPSVRTG